MNDLMKKLDVAYTVYEQANEYFVKARLLGREVQKREDGYGKHRVISWCMVFGAWFIGYFLEYIGLLKGGLISAMFIYLPIPVAIAYRMKIKMANKNFANSQQVLIDKENAAGQKILQDNARVFDFLPNNYVNLPAISSIRSIIQQGRAKTLPEALNLYDEQKHRQDMASRQRDLQDLLYAQYTELQGLHYDVKEIKRRS